MKKRNKKEYKYFIAFTYVRADGSSGRGSWQVYRSTPISDMIDLRTIELEIMEHFATEHLESVLIINFVKFEKRGKRK